jgi:hypothetical protein
VKEIALEAVALLKTINRQLQEQEVEVVAPLSEKCLKVVWKMGVFNFYILGAYIHCLLLEVIKYIYMDSFTGKRSSPIKTGNSF